jgi:enoyl-[acyl-carrier protein] reductase/trans-2-enoyl-CoA reductase (NAD+)
MIIKPKVRGFVCVTAHPAGCAAHVGEWISHVKSKGPIAGGPRKVLVIGASTGYGLASRVTAAFGSGAATFGIFYERPSDEGRPATPGWYNSIGFTHAARAAGLYAKNLNGDAFSNDIKAQALDAISKDLGQVDLVVYSLASPRRANPKTGVVHKSVLKPVGSPYTNKTVDTDKGVVSLVTIDPASEQEISDTGGRHGRRGLGALDERAGRGQAPRPGRPLGGLFVHRARGHLGDLQERDDRAGQERLGAGGEATSTPSSG